MAIQVDVNDLGARVLQADLGRTTSELKARIADVHETAGPIMVRAMKRKAPKDTGTLARSLDYKVNVRKQTLRLGALRRFKNPKSGKTADQYLPYVHDGTSRMPPRPFITDTIKEHTGAGSKLMRGYASAGVGPLARKVSW